MPDTWIPVAERLPEYNQAVLVSDCTDIQIGYYTDVGWIVGGAYWIEDLITHWQPLPAPPTPSTARSE